MKHEAQRRLALNARIPDVLNGPDADVEQLKHEILGLAFHGRPPVGSDEDLIGDVESLDEDETDDASDETDEELS